VYISFTKRLFDIVLSFVSILFLTPLFLAVSLAISIFDRGPIIFSQTRIGRNGVPFRLYKFRSMPVNTPTLPSDKLGCIRLHPIGLFIRRSNIDELPQLFNILKGDMSVVGPRPSLLDQVELLSLRQSNGSLSLKPGLTGLAQIRSFTGMTPSEKAALDAEYAARLSFRLDLFIILRTFIYLLSPPPVY